MLSVGRGLGAGGDEAGAPASGSEAADQLTADERGGGDGGVQAGLHLAASAESTDLVLVPLRLAGEADHGGQGVARQHRAIGAGEQLDRQVRVDRDRSAQADQVHTALVQQRLHHRTGPDAAGQHHRDAARGRTGPAGERGEVGLLRVRPGTELGHLAEQSRALVGAARDLDEVDALLDQQPDDLLRVVLGEAAVPEVRGVQLHRDREPVAGRPTSGTHSRQQRPRAAGDVAAPLVGTTVDVRREELGQQVAVGRVDLDAVETGLLAQGRRTAEPRDDRLDLAGFQRPWPGEQAQHRHGVAGARGHRPRGEEAVGLSPRVVELRDHR
nr:hypothetical protein [Nocardioides stalactiti]